MHTKRFPDRPQGCAFRDKDAKNEQRAALHGGGPMDTLKTSDERFAALQSFGLA